VPRPSVVALRRAPVAAVVAALAVALAACGGEPPRAAAAERVGPPPRIFAFVSNHGGAELRRLARVGARIDVVAPNWYALDASTGELRGPWDPRPLLRVAREHGVRVWPAVNSLTGGSRDWESRAARRRMVRALLAVARTRGARGVTLDMEELRPHQRDEFSALVRAAAARLHAAGRRLAVYVTRPGPGEGAAYDWRALARHADLVLCSGYNEHWSGGPPGPVTTSRGFAAVVDRALALAGPRRAVPVAGAFGYRWPRAGAGELISSVDAARLRRESGATARRSDGAERFRTGGDTVVYETAAGLRMRVAAARAAGARWVGLFSLGREPARFWRGLRTARG
jgi:spore germination protein